MQSEPPRLPEWFDRAELDAWLRGRGCDAFADSVAEICARRLDQPTNGDLKRWVAALDRLPDPERGRLDSDDGAVRVLADPEAGETLPGEDLRGDLMEFHPWRKGPLEFMGHVIDTEWRSDWKWQRVASCVDWSGQAVLDVGCGNGYFGWRMLDAGASMVVGLDPILRFLMQFEVFHRYAQSPSNHAVLPMLDTDLPERLHTFDIAFSAGVLYHRTSPIDHLRTLAGALVPGGTLVLETLIIEDHEPSVLVPEDRYAQMRNVWFLPSIPMLMRWILRSGFEKARVVDVTPTTTEEQRSTEWMRFQSLADFLDPGDPGKTIEGYPGPIRATVVATRSG